ncbi:MAG: tetratricopeptide repeat protein [Rhodospirillaceae bacterium]|nr:tetratricopeptide repeat protein [Rhodospirillaceae bacterium]
MQLRTLACVPMICIVWLSSTFGAAAHLCTPRPLPDRCLEPLAPRHWRQIHRLKRYEPGRYRAVVENCAAAVRRNPNNTSLRVAVATVLFNAGKREDATRLLSAPDLENDPLALYMRANFLYRSWNGRDKLPEMVRLAERAVASGSLDAVVLLGYAYEQDIVWSRNEGAAFSLYLKAARAGCAEGMVKAGMYYQFGTHVAQNWARALTWYLRAAEAWDAYAMFRAGYVYDEGPRELRNTDRAIYWYRRSASLGNGDGMLNLGWMYRHGKGVKRNYGKALYWYRKSYAAGIKGAVNNLAVMYLNGWGVVRNKRRAAAYFLGAAADRRNVTAMRNLGNLYDEKGNFWDSDPPAAYFWRYAAYRRAEIAGVRAHLRSDLIDDERKLPSAEAQNVRNEAVDWLNGGRLPVRYRKGIPEISAFGPP